MQQAKIFHEPEVEVYISSELKKKRLILLDCRDIKSYQDIDNPNFH